MIRAGTRTSRLARWQTGHVLGQLRQAWPELKTQAIDFTTLGDRDIDTPLPEIGGKGLFTAELETALLSGVIDVAVHSLKDLPTTSPDGIAVAAIPARADPRDTLVGAALTNLQEGAIVGTSSIRRAAQLLRLRPDLTIRSIRGNVPTRVRKVDEGQYDAAVLAVAGLERLDMLHVAAQILEPIEMLPAPGQGAIGVQCRQDDTQTLRLLAAIDDEAARATSTAERAFLSRLQAGCSSPVGALGAFHAQGIALQGVVLSLDGSREIRVSGVGADGVALGHALAEKALDEGAAELIHA